MILRPSDIRKMVKEWLDAGNHGTLSRRAGAALRGQGHATGTGGRGSEGPEMIDTIELLPCPFCGGAAEITRKGDRRQSTQYSCTWCGCFLETGEEWGHGTAWNVRWRGDGDGHDEGHADIIANTP